MMYRLSRLKIVLFTLAAGAVLMTGCGKGPEVPSPTPVIEATATETEAEPATNAPTPVPEPVEVRVNLGQAPQTIDPALLPTINVDPAGSDLAANLFISLTGLDPDTGLVGPALAKNWETADDGLTWTVYLRDDVFWVAVNPETGSVEKMRPVTAGDVVFSVQRVCNPATGAPLAKAAFFIQGCRELHLTEPDLVTPEMVEQTVGVRVLNDVAVEFRLESGAGAFPSVMAMPLLDPVPADLVESDGADWTQPAAIWTSGPFAVQPESSPEGYTLVTNPFWPLDRAGNVEEIQVSFIDDLDAVAAWERGEFDVSLLPASAYNITSFEDDPRYRQLVEPVLTMVAFSYDVPPFDNPDVRRALSLALDRSAIIKEVLLPAGANGVPARTMTPPGSAAAPRYGEVGAGFDPDAARAALDAAGYPDCQGFPPVTLLTDESGHSGEIAARIVQGWADVLNCPAETFAIDQQPYLSVLTALQTRPSDRQVNPPGMITLSWQADMADAHHWLADIIGCQELFPDAYIDSGRACVDADQQLLEALSSLDDPETRSATYAAIEEAFFGADGEMPVIPVFFHARAVALHPWMEVYPLHAGPLQFDRWLVDLETRP